MLVNATFSVYKCILYYSYMLWNNETTNNYCHIEKYTLKMHSLTDERK